MTPRLSPAACSRLGLDGADGNDPAIRLQPRVEPLPLQCLGAQVDRTSCRVAKVESASGGSPVDVVVTTEDRPRDHVPAELAAAWHGSLKTERAVRAILGVAAAELGQAPTGHGARREEVIEAFEGRVRTTRSRWKVPEAIGRAGG